MDRRTFLGAIAGTAVTGSTLAGCLGRGSEGDGGSDGGTGTGTGTGTDGGGGTTAGETVDSLPPPVMGDPEADATVMVFSDFACPHCASFEADVLPRIESEYVEPGRIRYEHRDFPIPVSERWSWAVAGAARAVQDGVGDDAFFEFSKACFSNQSSYSDDLLGRLARDVGADGEAVVSAAEAETYRPVVESDRSLGVELGLDGTPEVYVNREQLSGYDYDTVSSAIDAEL